MHSLHAHNQPGLPSVDWLIKWNPRTTDVRAVWEQLKAAAHTIWCECRNGKRLTVWEQAVLIEGITGAAAGTALGDFVGLIGQGGLTGPGALVRHPAKRRRLKTVLQELIYKAGCLIEHGRQLILGLGANDRAAAAFELMHKQLQAASG